MRTRINQLDLKKGTYKMIMLKIGVTVTLVYLYTYVIVDRVCNCIEKVSENKK